MIKNTAGQIVCFQLLSTTAGSVVTSGTPTVYILGDGGTQIAGTGTIVHEGNGVWSYEPTQANTNYSHIAFTMLLGGAFSQTVNVYTKAGDAYTAINNLNDISSSEVTTACTSSLNTYDAPTKAELDSGLAGLSIPTVSEINATVDTALSDYGANTTTPPTTLQIVDAIDNTSTRLSTIAGYLDTEISAIKSVTDNLPNSGALTSLTAYVDTLEATLANATYGLSAIKTTLDGVSGGTDAATIADAVWDELLSGHLITGSAGSALSTASSGGVDASVLADAIWDEAISGHTTAGTFGAKNQKVVPSETVGDYKTTPPTVTEIVTGVEAGTKLSAIAIDVAGLNGDAMRGTDNANTTTPSTTASIVTAINSSTVLTTIDTIVDAIKAKTDNLPSDPADQSLLTAAISSAHNSTDTILSSILADTGTDLPALISAIESTDTASITTAILSGVLDDLTDNSLNAGQSITVSKAIRALFNRFYREVTQTGSQQVIKNDSDSQIAVMTVSDDATIQTKGIAT